MTVVICYINLDMNNSHHANHCRNVHLFFFFLIYITGIKFVKDLFSCHTPNSCSITCCKFLTQCFTILHLFFFFLSACMHVLCLAVFSG